ncbi:MAG: ferritin-like domain-containing protein [Robiginitomaculum sp.]|nr:ferritin-like domain-containing protein [Robiginitomaculum sp.]
MSNFIQECLAVLQEPDPALKAKLALSLEYDCDHELVPVATIPDKPARPKHIKDVQPGKVSKRKWGSEKGRLALLHAVAHIELNAIDLAFDMIVRFSCTEPISANWNREFCKDWLLIGQEEAKHFGLISNLLTKRGMQYGDLAVHGGMWDAAINTKDRVDARLAIAPLVLEARGLDVTPPMIKKMKQAGDIEAANILEIIYEEEIGHVAMGVKWFERVCSVLKVEPTEHFKFMVSERFTAPLKPPFNIEARSKAGMQSEFYS